jgi:hypothetical protein
MKQKSLLFTFFLALSLPFGASAEIAEETHLWSFDAPTIELGYTVSTPDEDFFIGIQPGVLLGETDVTVKVFDHTEYVHREIYRVGATALEVEPLITQEPEIVTEPVPELKSESPARITVDWALPEGKEIVSPIYEFDIKGAADLYNPELPLWLKFHYLAQTQSNLGVYFWHKGEQAWIPIPTVDDDQDKSLKAAIHLTYAPMAILSDVIASEGEASWYAYHGCNCAASRDYPYGTLLEVTDLTTNNSVVVEVNDYGPELWTGRVIDLDLVAFEQLTEKWRGLTQVKVEPYIITEEQFEQEGLPEIFKEARDVS